MTDEEVVRSVYAAVTSGDIDAAAARLAPDAQVDTTVESFRGPDGAREWLARASAALDDYKIELLALTEVGGHIVCDTRQSGRGRGSGVEVAQEITHVWRVENGAVTAMRAFADRESALAFATGETLP